MNTRARVIHILSRALRMKRSTDAECGTTAARNSLVCSNQPVVAPKIVVNNKRRNVLSFYHGAMLTICLFAVSNYLWLAASWSSTNIVVRQSSLFDLRGIPSGNHDGDTRILLQKEGNAATEAYISQTIVKIPYTRQRLMANTSNKNSALEDITARVESPFSSSNPSSSSSLSCAQVNEEVLNMGNRTRLGTGEKILLVGLSKAGTTSVGGFFEKAGYNTCDFRCGPKVSNVSSTIGRCMWQAQQERKPLIASCGGEEIEMYAQMDTIGWPRKNFCFFPQIDALKELHSEHPDATLILNMRQDPDHWYDSVSRWYDLRQRLVTCASGPANDTSVAFKHWYCQHIQRIRSFAEHHPTHALVEINVQDPSTATRLASLFGTDPRHWMQLNQNLKTRQEVT